MPEKVKILECIRQGLIGGGESHLLSLVENLDRGRFDPVVLSFTDGPMIRRLEELGVGARIIPTERPFDMMKWPAVRNLLKKEGVQLVHAHGTRAASNVLWAARSLGIPVIYTIHGWSFHDDQSHVVRRLRAMGEKWLTAKADVNISVSESNRQSGHATIGPFSSVVINNGIDLNRYNPQRAHRDIRSELGIGRDKVLVVFIARFTAHKQPLTLMEAFRRALAFHPNLHLLMVGDGDQKAEALSWTGEAGLADRISFQGFRQDVPDILAGADIYVLPSLWEGLPIGLLEALAMGKAVIATAVDGTREIVHDGYNGLLVPPGDAAALGEALGHLAGDAALRKCLAGRALETVNQRFNAAEMTRKIETIYTRLTIPAAVAVA
jgi:glycosyltransferase involved in cell wall biosynthesis